MSDIERARKLREESREYHLRDPRWQANFRARVSRLAKKQDPMSADANVAVIMFLDHISLRIPVRLIWAEGGTA
jgi:hypothetical protein